MNIFMQFASDLLLQLAICKASANLAEFSFMLIRYNLLPSALIKCNTFFGWCVLNNLNQSIEEACLAD